MDGKFSLVSADEGEVECGRWDTNVVGVSTEIA